MKPLPLEQLIGGPLKALILAQGIAQQATAQFISDVGLAPPAAGEKEPRARTVSFSYLHPVPDPSNPGGVIETPVRVDAPLLALTQIPQVRVAEATINLETSVVDVIEEKPPQEALGGFPRSALAAPLSVYAVYAARAKDGPSTGLSFSIRVEREPLAEGLNRILALLQDAINTEPLKRR